MIFHFTHIAPIFLANPGRLEEHLGENSLLKIGPTGSVVIAVCRLVPVLESTLTCPQCGHSKTKVMPTNCCQYCC